MALALGGNTPGSADLLRRAAQLLVSLLGHPRCGALYRTAPQSDLQQPPYLNTAVVGETDLDPFDLLAIAKWLEHRAGRRPGPRWGPRPLDVDLLAYGDLVLTTPELTLPHPRLRSRRFVLAPLADAAPGLRLPPDGARVEDLLASVGQEAEVERIGPCC